MTAENILHSGARTVWTEFQYMPGDMYGPGETVFISGSTPDQRGQYQTVVKMQQEPTIISHGDHLDQLLLK